MKNCYADSHLFADDYPLFQYKVFGKNLYGKYHACAKST